MSNDAIILGDRVSIAFENKHVTLYWNPELQAIGTWFRPEEFGESWDSSETVKQALEGGLELIREHGATRWIADTREMPVMSAQTQQWVVEQWWPRAFAEGFRWLAILLPQSTMAKLAVDEAVATAEDSPSHETRYFGEVDAAKAWLRSKA